MDRLLYTFEIVKTTFRVVMTHPKLLIFAVLSSSSSIIVAATFLVPLFFVNPSSDISREINQPVIAEVADEEAAADVRVDPIGQKLGQASAWATHLQKSSQEHPAMTFGYMFLFYFCLCFVSAFFNTAVISCASKVFAGEQPSLRAGLGAALSLIHYLAVWVLISCTVGAALNVAQNRSGKIGEFMGAIAGFVWSIATCFVVPVMAVERLNPMAAIDTSFDLIKKTWGENIVGQTSFAVIFAVLRFFWIVILGIGLFMGGPMILTFFVLSLVYLFFVEMFSVLVEPVFIAALYRYAKEGQVAEGFEDGVLQASFA